MLKTITVTDNATGEVVRTLTGESTSTGFQGVLDNWRRWDGYTVSVTKA